ncbi:rhomboid family intramembrane serine protease [Sphingobacterium sp. DN00404]|uniref:Rhomboid family intramembrane serine protease n=1 Tax=Sphingobacterium micropteri TaxID=2763501 RepID=A0ABR7YTB4_9SPHI|nr:rhomboid family intramembrane serine protease [Sphingobacterium micropteri]MBD1434413.1 rhomboid family intramembrane serine protease [Sphingobacterium micropteri]
MSMSFFEIFPTFKEAPYSYIIVPIMLVSSVIGFYHKPYFHALLLHPYEVYRGKRLHTILTSAFVHRNWFHLLFNCIAVQGLLYDVYGNLRQERGLFYADLVTPILTIAIIAIPNIAQIWKERMNFLFTSVGASGLSFGLFGFSFLFFPLQEIDHLFIPLIKNASQYWLYVSIIIVLLSFVKQLRINRTLHIIGYLIGSLLALLVRNESLFEFIDAFSGQFQILRN